MLLRNNGNYPWGKSAVARVARLQIHALKCLAHLGKAWHWSQLFETEDAVYPFATLLWVRAGKAFFFE